MSESERGEVGFGGAMASSNCPRILDLDLSFDSLCASVSRRFLSEDLVALCHRRRRRRGLAIGGDGSRVRRLRKMERKQDRVSEEIGFRWPAHGI
jgi:hypothetical protein